MMSFLNIFILSHDYDVISYINTIRMLYLTFPSQLVYTCFHTNNLTTASEPYVKVPSLEVDVSGFEIFYYILCKIDEKGAVLIEVVIE